MSKTIELARRLERLHINNMYKSDFYWTWDKTDEELEAIFTVADALRDLRERNQSTRIFDSGLGISIFRDNSTRTRFSFASACNLLGLEVQDLDEKKSQIAHGETVRETANMVSFMADVIGIRDDMFIGEGHKYQKTFMDALDEGYRDGILEQRPTLVNLQCDVDHPTQCMADMLHMIHQFGGVENLKGKKIAMTWAYSPSYGKPLSVPQGVIGLMTRFGMDVVLAHPEGYDVMPEVEEIAKKNAAATGGSYKKVATMEEAFDGADIVYPVSNRALFRDTEEYGCILSEFAPGTPPAKWTFPKRNRIISGLSCGVLVVEAPEKSGALITATTALEQGREVFAVPGPFDAPMSRGTNALIREGAGLVCEAWDVLSFYERPLSPQAAASPRQAAAPAQGLDPAGGRSRARRTCGTRRPIRPGAAGAGHFPRPRRTHRRPDRRAVRSANRRSHPYR